MTTKIIIETEAPLARVQTVLSVNGITVEAGTGSDLKATVPDSRDPEDEVTRALDDAGIVAYVYEAQSR
jgi:hypothetical protein